MDKTRLFWRPVEGLKYPFDIGAVPVTFEQYDIFCTDTGFKLPKDDFGRGEHPVINVNVADAVAYCKWATLETGLKIRLPKDDEWRYAARGGLASLGYTYSGSNKLDEVAWYDDNAYGRTHAVGQLEPNELGIYVEGQKDSPPKSVVGS